MNDALELHGLLEGVKQRNPEAFAQLISLFRPSALSWSRAVVRDAYLAEDVVQEAFIRLPDKLPGLRESGKFAPWFRLMVRRLSINAIRGASRERSGLPPELSDGEKRMPDDPSEADPDEWQARADRATTVGRSLAALSPQAREVLIASASGSYSPEELAARFGMNKSNVYNVLSRARTKANDKRFRDEADRYLQERREAGKPKSVVLAKPQFARPYAFLSVMIGEALRSAGEPEMAHPLLMGVSGDAFRLNVPEACRWQGISTFDWSYAAYRTLERLGIAGTCFGRPQRRAIAPEEQSHLFSVIHGSLDRGVPAIVRNMEINRFGFIYGYDDAKREFRYWGYNRKEIVCGYEQLGREDGSAPLFVLGIKGRNSPGQSADAALRAIADHARGKEPPLPGFAFGLAGYDRWIAAAEDGTLDLHGHAYQVAILAEARQQAVDYLTDLAERSDAGEARRVLLGVAAERYRRVGETFSRLYPSFPFGYRGSGGNLLPAVRAGLAEAQTAESEGIAAIEQLLDRR